MGRALAATAPLVLVACLGTTGNSIVRFAAAAAGPRDATAGAPLEFTSDRGWHVVLTTATLHVGAMYLVQTLPASGGGPSSCVLPGTYVAQATTNAGTDAGIDVDVLSPAPKLFPNPGQGTDLPAKAGQVWLTGGPVDQVDDATTILHIEGTADRSGASYPFVGCLTIGQNRVVQPSDSTKPGSQPICHQRIVSPIPVNLVPQSRGTLLLRVDPRQLFVGIDFSKLKPSSTPSSRCASSGGAARFQFADDSSDEPSALLYSALLSAGPLYQFTWE